MKIGILTQPLYCNYGGILQCFALQHTLQRIGHETCVIRREWNRQYTITGACKYYAKVIVKKIIGRKCSWHYYVSQAKRDYIARDTGKFIDRCINPRSRQCYTTEQLHAEADRWQFDAIIVGSDQVWRPEYSPCLPNFFLDFLPLDSNVKRISYAASFGLDDWTAWSPNLTSTCAMLLQRFDAISVRESSAIRLCKEHFMVDAVHVLDPTMLLDKDDYLAIIQQPTCKRGDLFCYVLDKSDDMQRIIHYIAQKTGMTPFQSMPELDDSTYNLYGEIDKSVYPPVENWISAFVEAEIIVTDSFHGAAFSIIFNKPFWVVGNKGRGMARFETLLAMFGLENRMINNHTVSSIDIYSKIDWASVNAKRKKLQTSSLDFIHKSLCENTK